MQGARVETAAPIEITPERFGRYVLLDRIGSGGMADVFRAVMPGVEGFQRTFVVKRILSERAKSPYFVDMFIQEARINAILHHPNIVQVFDFGNVDGTYFLAMEYVRGRDVSAILRRLREGERPCPVGVAVFIAHEVAQALAYAHALAAPDGRRLDIVHRDISPANIICPRIGGVKLLDFGIAKALGEPEVEKTGQGLFKGKLSYVAPERIKDRPHDARSDLFSLGVVLWELLAGRKLFRGKSDFQTLKNVAEMEVPAPSSLRPDVPPELDAIVARVLARDPAERHPNGQALAEELDCVLARLQFQPRALPELLQSLFGSELTSRQIPTGKLTADLIAACAAETSNGAVPVTGTLTAAPVQAAPPPYELSVSAAVSPRPRSRWASWVAATVGTATLVVLLVGRGGGGRSHGAPLPVDRSAAPAPALAPEAVPTEAVLSPTSLEPASIAANTQTTPPGADKPVRRPRPSVRGRIARGLSVDPFAEAASRVAP